ncbi:DNA-3-methyladenine glycosylase [Marinilabiliaceae bacterium ANBcel2]|nr:DNA-3-methyladenine glycosylase [Marinilabiliaceae bacterium ANBcel2]
MEKIYSSFFSRDALEIAPQILGMQIVRQFEDKSRTILTITEVEVYKGKNDLGCHASKGRTPRTEIMFHKGGKIYVYLIYGIHWLLNITTGAEDDPQAILIRGSREIKGPGRIGKALALDKSFYDEDIGLSNRLWLQWNRDKKRSYNLKRAPRIGIDYAGEYWSKIPWRFIAT